MNTALRIPSRWAGWSRSLAITATLSAALGACTTADNVMYGAREGTMEYPGSAAGPNAVPTYVVKNKDTVDGIASRYGVSRQSIVERNNCRRPTCCALARRCRCRAPGMCHRRGRSTLPVPPRLPPKRRQVVRGR